MKQRNKRWLGLAVIPIVLALFALASPASAADYSGNCANIGNFNGTGNVMISDASPCVLSSPLTATGTISIGVTNTIDAGNITAGSYLTIIATGNVTTGALDAQDSIYVESEAKVEVDTVTTHNQGYIWIQAEDDLTTNTLQTDNQWYIHLNSVSGKIDTKDVTGGTIWLEAEKDIKSGSLTTVYDDHAGQIQINANKGGYSTLFTIGGTGNDNGINGTVNTASTNGGGTNNNYIRGGLYVVNGDESSTGGITVSDMTAISVVSSNSRSGMIFLNAQNGTLTLPAGVLSADGGGGGAGVINLRAATIDTASGTIISANQTSSDPDTYHGINIAADVLTVTGSGLEIRANGNGVSDSLRGFVFLMPRQELYLTTTMVDDMNPNTPNWAHNYFYSSTPVHVTGDGAFKATANGDNAWVHVSGLPVRFSNTDVTLESKGATDHQVIFEYVGTVADTDGLIFDGDGEVKIDVSGVDGPGGKLIITVDKMTVSSSALMVKADAPNDGDHAGGIVTITSTELNIEEDVEASISANSHGAGFSFLNAISVNIGTGEVYFDKLSAKGQTDPLTVGFPNITVLGTTGSKLTVTNSIDTSVPGSTGTAGTIRLEADDIVFDGSTPSSPSISANSGTSSGEGGRIFLIGNESISVAADNTHFSANGKDKGGRINIEAGGYFGVAYGVGTLSMEAKGLGAAEAGYSDGGEIKIVAGGTIDLYGQAVNVEAGPTGGKGGNIEVQGAQINIDGNLVSNGSDFNGDGGEIRIDSTSGQLTLATGSTITAIGKNTGSGGVIVLTGSTLDLGTGTIDASAGDAGTIDNALLPTSISITSTSTTETTTFAEGLTIKAVGGPNNDDTESGVINIQTGAGAIINSTVDASNGSSAGVGGSISVVTGDRLTINGLLTVSVTDNAARAGLIELSYKDSSNGAAPVVIGSGGSITADQPLEQEQFAGTIIVSNSLGSAVGVTLNGLLSAENGLIIIPPTFTAQPLEITGEGKMVGALEVTSASDVLLDLDEGSITIKVIQATGNVSITTADGDILSRGDSPVTAEILTLNSGGNIGDGGYLGLGPRFQTSVKQISVTANITNDASVAITNTNEPGDDLEVLESTASGTFALNTNNSLTIGSVSSTNEGGLYLQGDGDTITIADGAVIKAFNGIVSIGSVSSSTKLTVDENASIISLGGSNPSFLSIVIGALGDTFEYSGSDANLVITGTEAPRIGINGFTANPDPSSVSINAASVGMLLYGPDSDSITFNGSNVLIAQD